jgi:hypothetical protein
MRSNLRGQSLRRLAALLVITAPLLVATGAPASASPPSNDDINNATAITSLPFRDVLDLSQATWDSSTDQAYCDARNNHSVWYSFTPASDQRVVIDPSPSDPYVTVVVLTGSPGALTFLTCVWGAGLSNGGVILNATAGTTYWIMGAPTCCWDPTTLDLSVYPAVAPQLPTLTVDGGTVDVGGNATINGTLSCVGSAPNGVRLEGTVRQPVGRLSSVSAGFVTTAACDQSGVWAVLAQPSEGRFAGGQATVNVTGRVCNIVGCASSSTTAVVRLRGGG